MKTDRLMEAVWAAREGDWHPAWALLGVGGIEMYREQLMDWSVVARGWRAEPDWFPCLGCGPGIASEIIACGTELTPDPAWGRRLTGILRRTEYDDSPLAIHYGAHAMASLLVLGTPGALEVRHAFQQRLDEAVETTEWLMTEVGGGNLSHCSSGRLIEIHFV